MDYLTDIHCHLHEPEFKADLNDVFQRAVSVGIKRFVCNSGSIDDMDSVCELAANSSMVLPCYGVHPWFAQDLPSNWLEKVESFVRSGKCGIGEIGLDTWKKDIAPLDLQVQVFRSQLAVARDYNRPAMIHCLKAIDQLYEILQADGGPKCGFLLHAYSGPWTMVESFVKMGAYFSFSHAVLAPDRRKAHKVVSSVPLERFLLESDSPDLVGPEPYRPFSIRKPDGRFRQEPANIVSALDGFARIRDIKPAELQKRVIENSDRFLAELL